MKFIYPAGPFSWQAKILAHAQELRSLGYGITGRWLAQEPQFTRPDNSTVVAAGLHSHCQDISVRDIADIATADTLILFEPGVAMERVTRVAEFGVALALGKQCIVIGPEDDDKKDVISSVFVYLNEIPEAWKTDEALKVVRPVVRYPRWIDFLVDITNPEKVEVCGVCGGQRRKQVCGCQTMWGVEFFAPRGQFAVKLPAEHLRQSSSLAKI